MLMYGERRRCTDKPKGYARGKTSGLARVESVADLMEQPSEKQSVSYMNPDTSWKTSVSGVCLTSYFGRLLINATGEVCPKEAVGLFRVLAHGVVCLVRGVLNL